MKMKIKILLSSLVGLSALLLGLLFFRRPATVPAPEPLPNSPSVAHHVPVKGEDGNTAQQSGAPGSASASVPRASAQQRKFAEMSAVESNAILQEIGREDLTSIFRAMIDAERVQHDPMKQQSLQTTLTWAISQRGASAEFIQMLNDFLADPQNKRFEKQLIIGTLGEAATKETLELLVTIATGSLDPTLRELAKGSIGAAGKSGNRVLAPSLDRLWNDTQDRDLLRSAARSMARLGAPSSVDLLLDAALGGEDAERVAIARSILPDIYRTTAVPPLAARLVDQIPSSETAKLVAPILVGIGDQAAAAVLLDWLRGSEADASALIQERLLPNTRSPVMLSAWKSVVAPAVSFRNERNREAIKSALARRDAGRKLQ